MKPFYGIDLTQNKKNEIANGEEFLVAEPSDAMAQALENSAEGLDTTIEKARAPMAMRVAQWIGGAVGTFSVIVIIRLIGKGVTLGEIFRNQPWLLLGAGVGLALWSVLKFMGNKRERRVFESDEGTQSVSRLQTTVSSVFREMGVPEDAPEVDVLSFYYKEKEGEIKVCEKPMQLYSHTNCGLKIFTDSDHLYLAHTEGKFAFPLKSLQAIRRVDKKVRATGWNKEEAPNQGIYQSYKLTTDQYGCVHSKPHYLLEFVHGGETWGVYFPCYELPVFEKLTGLQAQ